MEIIWPKEPGNYKLGKGIHIAIAELGDSRFDIPEELYAIKGSIFTPNEGIVRLVRNVVSNPNIKYLVLVGEDVPGFWPGQALICLKKNGVDRDSRIIGAKGYMPYVKRLSASEIEEFRKRVEIIDLRGRELRDILKVLRALPLPPRRIPVKIINVNREYLEEARIYDNPLIIGDLIEEKTMMRIWPVVLRHIWLFGKVVENPRGRVKEVILLVSRILNPLKDRYFTDYKWSKDELDNYVAESFLNPEKPVAAYSYGNRLFGHGRLEDVINYLRENKETRRAVVSLWIPIEDVGSNDPPCLTQIQFFIRDKRLHLIAYWRSHDMFGAAPANWYGLSKLMELVSEKIGTKIGVLTTISASAHIYEADWGDVVRIIGKYPMDITAQPKPFVSDPKGYILIKVSKESQRIILEHYNSNHELLYRITGSSAEEISHELSRHTIGLRPEHYLYIGRELIKAELALKTNLEYKQDFPLKI